MSILDILRGRPVERTMADGSTVWLRPLSFGQLIALEAETDSAQRVAMAVSLSVWDPEANELAFCRALNVLDEISMLVALELMPMITEISSPQAGDAAPLSQPSDATPESGE